MAEVLSPSTMRWDRGGKVEFYNSIPSLQAILLVYQDEVRVEAWWRNGDGWRREVRQTHASSLDLPALGGSVTLAEIYVGLEIEG